jgi:hypothetical protein
VTVTSKETRYPGHDTMDAAAWRSDGGFTVAIEIEGSAQVAAANTATEMSATEQALPVQARTATG